MNGPNAAQPQSDMPRIDPLVELEFFARLQDSAYHAAERAWSGFLSFITAQALLAAAWAALWASDAAAAPPMVLPALSIIGVVSGFVWAMLGTRMWHYHLVYVRMMDRVSSRFTQERFGPAATAWREVDAEIARYWRDPGEFSWLRLWSSNQNVLFWAPMLLGLIHFMMFFASYDGSSGVQVSGLIVYLFLWAALWNICEPVLHLPTWPSE